MAVNLEAIGHYEDVTEIAILNPHTGDPITDDETGDPWLVQLAGPDHKKTIDANNWLNRLSANLRRRSGRGDGFVEDTLSIRRRNVEYMARRTVGWINGPSVFTVEAAVAVYEKWKFVADQVNTVLGDDTNFLAAAKVRCSPSPKASSAAPIEPAATPTPPTSELPA